MKRLLTVLLAIAMLVSVVVIVTVPAAAVDGEWSVFANRGNYSPSLEEDDNIRSVPGYEYTDEGLHMIPAVWSDTSPWGTIQTTEAVDLKDGVYMEVRIDNFTYSGDKWFGFNLRDVPEDVFVRGDDEDSYGCEILMRPSEDKNLSTIAWQHRVATNKFELVEQKPMGDNPDVNVFDDQGRAIYTFEIQWSDADEMYYIYVNGIMSPAKFCRDVTNYIEEECDGKMHVGFSLQNSVKGGTVECTLLSYGTSKDEASIPQGTDRRDPENNSSEIAEIAPADSVEDGMPAILMNADKIGSDTRRFNLSSGESTVNDDYSLNIKNNTNSALITYSVKNNVSYDVKDFPIVLVITRNLCTCPWTDTDDDGVIADHEKLCMGIETAVYYAMTGDAISPTPDQSENFATMGLAGSDYDADGNHYGYCIADWSAYSGRIHSIRFDLYNIRFMEPGRDSFDILEVGFFRTEEDAYNHYLEVLEQNNVGIEDTTTPSDGETTEPTGDVTTEPVDNQTTEPIGNVTTESDDEETTEKTVQTTQKTEQTTEKTEQTTKAPEGGDDEGGCASVAGVGAVAVVVLAVAGLVSFRKKED